MGWGEDSNRTVIRASVGHGGVLDTTFAGLPWPGSDGSRGPLVTDVTIPSMSLKNATTGPSVLFSPAFVRLAVCCSNLSRGLHEGTLLSWV